MAEAILSTIKVIIISKISLSFSTPFNQILIWHSRCFHITWLEIIYPTLSYVCLQCKPLFTPLTLRMSGSDLEPFCKNGIYPTPHYNERQVLSADFMHVTIQEFFNLFPVATAYIQSDIIHSYLIRRALLNAFCIDNK